MKLLKRFGFDITGKFIVIFLGEGVYLAILHPNNDTK